MLKSMIRAAAVTTLVAAGSLAVAPAALAQDTMKSDTGAMAGDMPMVGGAPMDPQKTIPENASQADNLTTLVAAVKAAGLVETLSGDGPFTVFAPTNAAFEKLPAGTVDDLLKPENKDKLTKILTYHVVPAKATSEAAMQMIKDDGGAHTVKTVEGEPITLRMDGDNLVVIDASGNGAVVTQADVMQSNGVVHVIDTVLMPKM
ncbi:fasciclin domain-containing protein [Jiella avicenniae]|uniref:Fasciclin domain-containing protein n=1 Tax=Jiella avicenniae TaxID=2907202 RepID=A0A9X1T6F1_9HYPH|nr:fasciclin domain-containing protein [Jiella avicenniae]MCE7029305.1 fasciclin domain-containing protein [Jiella avicenniae]